MARHGHCLHIRPAVVPGFRPPVFWSHGDSQLEYGGKHHVGHHPTKAWEQEENCVGAETSEKWQYYWLTVMTNCLTCKDLEKFFLFKHWLKQLHQTNFLLTHSCFFLMTTWWMGVQYFSSVCGPLHLEGEISVGLAAKQSTLLAAASPHFLLETTTNANLR